MRSMIAFNPPIKDRCALTVSCLFSNQSVTSWIALTYGDTSKTGWVSAHEPTWIELAES